MKQVFRKSKRRVRFFIMLALFLLYIGPAQAIDLAQIRVYSDTSKSASDRFHSLLDLLIEEVSSPVALQEGWGGGQIDHDYIVTQLALAMSFVAKETEDGRTQLLKTLEHTSSTEAKEAVFIALGLAGDASVSKELTGLLNRPGQPHRRALAASALGECGSVLSIPELVEALGDSSMTHNGLDVGQPSQNDYPVRRAASLALRHLGVAVKHSDPAKEFDYQVDLDSAVKVVEPLLHSTNNASVMDAIQAIKRMSGSRARETLQGFVKQNEEEASRQDLVIAAKAALTDIAVPGSVP